MANKTGKKAKVIGIISIKGGVGKTTTVSNLGTIMARTFGKRVLILDANFSAPNLGVHLGVIDPAITIHDVLQNNADIKDSVHKHGSGFDLIPASLRNKKINPLHLRSKLKELHDKYDVILIDSSPSMNNEILATIMAADELVVVTSPDYPTLSTTLQSVKLANHLKAQIRGLVINRVRNKRYELSLEDIEAAAEHPVIALIPEDISTYEALFATTPVALHKPNAKITKAYTRLAACLLDEQYNERGIVPTLRRLFNRKTKL